MHREAPYPAHEHLAVTRRATMGSMRQPNRLPAAYPDLPAHEPPATQRDRE